MNMDIALSVLIVSILIVLIKDEVIEIRLWWKNEKKWKRRRRESIGMEKR